MDEFLVTQAVAIDRAGSSDRDDAVWVEPSPDGFEITVTVALPSLLLESGSPDDLEALRRGWTRYRATYASAPMLSRRLESAATLGARDDQQVLVVQTTVAGNGAASSVVGVGRLGRCHVVDHAAPTQAIGDPGHELHRMMVSAAHLAGFLLERRRRRGALAVFDLRAGVATTEEGLVIRLDPDHRHIGFFIVQELMILANEQVACWAAERGLPILYRNHQATAVAPDRAALAAELEAVAAHPDQFDFDTVLAHRNLITRPATYDPTVVGHWALNLPAYTHVTSPLRRFADLHTQRVILGHLAGLDSKTDSVTVAEYLNEAYLKYRTARSERLKEKSRAELRVAAGVARDADLETFAKIVGEAARGGNEHPDLVGETRRRLVADQVDVRLAHAVLFAPDGPWGGLGPDVAAWLARRPEAAVSLASMLAQTEGLPLPAFEEEEDPVGFRCRAAMVRGTPRVSGWWTAATKRLARQRSAVDVICRLAGVPTPEQVDVAVVAGDNPIGRLNDWTMAARVSSPTYQFTTAGPSHAPTFVATVEVAGRAREGRGSSKMEAKTVAAAAILADLATTPIPSSAPKQTVVGNPIGELNELAQRRRVRLPTYTYIAKGPSHSPSFEATVAVANVTATGEGATKTDAKAAAAAGALKLL